MSLAIRTASVAAIVAINCWPAVVDNRDGADVAGGDDDDTMHKGNADDAAVGNVDEVDGCCCWPSSTDIVAGIFEALAMRRPATPFLGTVA